MEMQQTSLEAFSQIKERLNGKRLEVYNVIRILNSANNLMIAKALGWQINRVTPRVKELREYGFVVKDSVRQCPYTKMNTIYWRIK